MAENSDNFKKTIDNFEGKLHIKNDYSIRPPAKFFFFFNLIATLNYITLLF